MPLLLFISLNQQTTLKFYTDIISSSIFCNQISYLANYDEIQLTDYGMVVCGESIVKDIVGKVIKGDANKLNQIKSIVNEQINNILQQQKHQEQQQNDKASLISAISQSIFNRLQQIKAQYLLNAVSLGSLHLIDVNWKITKTISSQARSFVGQKLPYLFTLILYLKGSSSSSGQQQITSSNNNIRQITLQLTKVQLRQFIGQFRSLKTQLQ